MKAAALLAAACAALGLGGGAHPVRLQVVADEYGFSLSRVHVRAGTAVVELANFGEDPHDLRVQRLGARHVAGTKAVAPGARAELTLRLAPGRYSFWCSLADHRARGMRAIVTVAR